MASDDKSFDLERFVRAQGSDYTSVTDELRRGRKVSHWIWYIFPQLRGLGRSAMADRYGIVSQGEAVAYWSHPVLGPRLRECVELTRSHRAKSAQEIFGDLDAMKFRSSMTLFQQALPDEALFASALDQFFGGQADQLTLDLLKS